MAGNTSTAGRTVTSRVLGLLGAFDAEHRQLTLTGLAARADLSLPTAHRLVAELEAWGALARRDGKILLAHAPDDVQEAALRSLTRVTPYTITNPATFRRQLARVRIEGYATTSEEMSLGACSVAVPIMKMLRPSPPLGWSSAVSNVIAHGSWHRCGPLPRGSAAAWPEGERRHGISCLRSPRLPSLDG